MRSIEIYQQHQNSDLNGGNPSLTSIEIDYIPRPVRLESDVKRGVNLSVCERIPVLDNHSDK